LKDTADKHVDVDLVTERARLGTVVGFQTLLSWISLTDDCIRSQNGTMSRCFKPCCRGSR
jgi:hypothetical protein